jgi:hypothetical protein
VQEEGVNGGVAAQEQRTNEVDADEEDGGVHL